MFNGQSTATDSDNAEPQPHATARVSVKRSHRRPSRGSTTVAGQSCESTLDRCLLLASYFKAALIRHCYNVLRSRNSKHTLWITVQRDLVVQLYVLLFATIGS